MTNREAFEAWFDHECGVIDDNGQEWAWLGWQAAIAQRTEPQQQVEPVAWTDDALRQAVVEMGLWPADDVRNVPHQFVDVARRWQRIFAPPAVQAVTDQMIDSYLEANSAYWREVDAKPFDATKPWRQGTPREATRTSLEAALRAAPPAVQAEPTDQLIARLRSLASELDADDSPEQIHPGSAICSQAADMLEAFRLQRDLNGPAWERHVERMRLAEDEVQRLKSAPPAVQQAEPTCAYCGGRGRTFFLDAQGKTCSVCFGTGRAAPSAVQGSDAEYLARCGLQARINELEQQLFDLKGTPPAVQAEPVACTFGCTTQEEHDAHYAAPPADDEAVRLLKKLRSLDEILSKQTRDEIDAYLAKRSST